MQNYAIGSTVTVPELVKRPYSRYVLVMGSYFNRNSFMFMPMPIVIASNSNKLTVPYMWNTQTNDLQRTGNVDLMVLDVDYVT